MKLSQLCEVKYGLPVADFYIYARGSEKNIGMPIEKPDIKDNKIGIKVKKEAKDIILPDYLYFIFMHLYNSKYWQNNGLVYGSLELKHLRIEDVINLSFSN
jgi:hypothetical protein